MPENLKPQELRRYWPQSCKIYPQKRSCKKDNQTRLIANQQAGTSINFDTHVKALKSCINESIAFVGGDLMFLQNDQAVPHSSAATSVSRGVYRMFEVVPQPGAPFWHYLSSGCLRFSEKSQTNLFHV
jgi:hypothetical protein